MSFEFVSPYLKDRDRTARFLISLAILDCIRTFQANRRFEILGHLQFHSHYGSSSA